ncbi:MAG: cobalt-precorrin 5A hydrolase [Candidatus Bathyarchaeia archaeon]|jgi:cobalt-precorrin 5A hydrolase
MYAKGIAVIAITRRGVETALRIKEALVKAGFSSKVYAPKKYVQNDVVPLDIKLDQFVKDTYSSIDALVGVMATGIIIRSVAPLLESKLTDPAVIGVDASGNFVISLLSGHYGGANELTKIIAQGIGATAVITTASDAAGKQSVDELARILHLSIQNPESLVAVNSAIVNGDHLVVVLIGDIDIPTNQIGCYEIKRAENAAQALEITNNYDAGILVSDKLVLNEVFRIDKVVKPFTILKTKRVVVGLGSRKSSTADSIIEGVDTALDQAHITLAIVDRFATVDIKRDSPAMLKAAEQLGKPLEFLSVDALRSVSYKGLSPDSKMVQEKIGVGGVCERAALLVAGKNSKLILKKTKLNGVTVAIAEGE